MASRETGLLGSITGSGGFVAEVTMESGGLAPIAPFGICLTSCVPGPREPGCFRTWL